MCRQKEELSLLQLQLDVQHEKRVREVHGEWKKKLETASSEASMSMQSIQAAAAEKLAQEKHAHAAEIGQKEAHHKEQVEAVVQRHVRDLAEAKAGHEAAFKGMKQDLDRLVWEKDKMLAEHKLRSSQELKSAQVWHCVLSVGYRQLRADIRFHDGCSVWGKAGL